MVSSLYDDLWKKKKKKVNIHNIHLHAVPKDAQTLAESGDIVVEDKFDNRRVKG